MRTVISCIIAVGMLATPVMAGGIDGEPLPPKPKASSQAGFQKTAYGASSVRVIRLQPMTNYAGAGYAQAGGYSVGGAGYAAAEEPSQVPRSAYGGYGGYGGGYGNGGYGNGGYGGYAGYGGYGLNGGQNKQPMYGFAGPRLGVRHLQPMSQPQPAVMKPQPRQPMMMKPPMKPAMAPAMMPGMKPPMKPGMGYGMKPQMMPGMKPPMRPAMNAPMKPPMKMAYMAKKRR